MSGKQRARKAPNFTARVSHRHLLHVSGWLHPTSVRSNPASSPLSLAREGNACVLANAIRRHAPFLPALGRSVPVAFMRRVECSLVGFHWSCSSSRFGTKTFPHHRLAFSPEACPARLKPSPCPHCPSCFILTVECECGFRGAVR